MNPHHRDQVTAALWLSQAVARHMQQQGSGAIVHVTARQGIEPAGGMAAYSASKAALAHLTRTLDIELRLGTPSAADAEVTTAQAKGGPALPA